jgi:hypothetical protein
MSSGFLRKVPTVRFSIRSYSDVDCCRSFFCTSYSVGRKRVTGLDENGSNAYARKSAPCRTGVSPVSRSRFGRNRCCHRRACSSERNDSSRCAGLDQRRILDFVHFCVRISTSVASTFLLPRRADRRPMENLGSLVHRSAWQKGSVGVGGQFLLLATVTAFPLRC